MPLIKVIAYSTENWREKHAACGPDIDGPDFIWKIIEEKEKKIFSDAFDNVINNEFILFVQKVLARQEAMENTSNQTGSSSPNFRIDVIFNSLRELQQGCESVFIS